MDSLTATLGVAVLALVLLSAALLVALRRAHARAEHSERTRHAEQERLREQVAAIERRLAEPRPPRQSAGEYLITDLGTAPTGSPSTAGTQGTNTPTGQAAGRIDGRLFADLVARETVVKAASLAHGVRRALAPETRTRVRAEMRREVKRARKERRTAAKQAVRADRARQRRLVEAEPAGDRSDEDAA